MPCVMILLNCYTWKINILVEHIEREEFVSSCKSYKSKNIKPLPQTTQIRARVLALGVYICVLCNER